MKQKLLTFTIHIFYLLHTLIFSIVFYFIKKRLESWPELLTCHSPDYERTSRLWWLLSQKACKNVGPCDDAKNVRFYIYSYRTGFLILSSIDILFWGLSFVYCNRCSSITGLCPLKMPVLPFHTYLSEHAFTQFRIKEIWFQVLVSQACFKEYTFTKINIIRWKGLECHAELN